MKLSENTIKILKNYSTINPSILIRASDIIATRSIAGNILVECVIEETFPVEFALYDLQEFLNTLKLFSAPILDFRDAENGHMFICEEDNIDFKVEYGFANKNTITYPTNRPVLPSEDIIFDLDNSTLDSIMKASSIMQLPNMIITPSDKDKMINIEVLDIKDPSSNKFSIGIDAEVGDVDFKIIFNMDSLKMIPDDYIVYISKNTTAKFQSDNMNYFIGLDIMSTFG